MSKQPSNIKCPICSKSVELIYVGYPGYVDGTYFDIYKCKNCWTQFISAPDTTNDIYDAIYSLSCVPGYDRYKRYVKEILGVANPLNYLSKQEFAYNVIYEFIKTSGLENLKILEIGSGLGYLTYSLNKAGHSALGIDISSESIEKAKLTFGDYYLNCDLSLLNKYKNNPKFDLIIATELIEHVTNPLSLINDSLSLLNDNGSILLTTPNYFIKDMIWNTDLPPIHRFWFSQDSFKNISDKFNLDISFLTPNITSLSQNLLVHYLLSKLRKQNQRKLPHSILSKDLSHCLEGDSKNNKRRVIKNFINSKLIKNPSNYFFHRLIKENYGRDYSSLAIVFKKKQFLS